MKGSSGAGATVTALAAGSSFTVLAVGSILTVLPLVSTLVPAASCTELATVTLPETVVVPWATVGTGFAAAFTTVTGVVGGAAAAAWATKSAAARPRLRARVVPVEDGICGPPATPGTAITGPGEAPLSSGKSGLRSNAGARLSRFCSLRSAD